MIPSAGQTRPVTEWFIMVNGSIESRMLQMCRDKKSESNEMLSQSHQSSQTITTNETSQLLDTVMMSGETGEDGNGAR